MGFFMIIFMAITILFNLGFIFMIGGRAIYLILLKYYRILEHRLGWNKPKPVEVKPVAEPEPEVESEESSSDDGPMFIIKKPK